MRLGDQRESDNVEDQRGIGGRGIALGGGGMGVIVLAIVIYLCGAAIRPSFCKTHRRERRSRLPEPPPTGRQNRRTKMVNLPVR